ncbi:MAG: hypothetical protein LBF41_03310 [Deltaproteobacteria bacterium]|jgi:hypothetical protein|nr:hypothetical protein [Deltaproteobacteria bacterium]
MTSPTTEKLAAERLFRHGILLDLPPETTLRLILEVLRELRFPESPGNPGDRGPSPDDSDPLDPVMKRAMDRFGELLTASGFSFDERFLAALPAPAPPIDRLSMVAEKFLR